VSIDTDTRADSARSATLDDLDGDTWDPGIDPLGDTHTRRRRIAGIDVDSRFGAAVSQLRYATRDAIANIARRGGLAFSVICTIALCATMAGASILARSGIDTTLGRWADGVEFVVYLDPAAPPEDLERLRGTLEADPSVRNVTEVTQAEAYDDYAELYADTPEMVEAVTADLLPASLRVAPTAADPELITEIANSVGDDAAVYRVVTANDAVTDMRDLSRTVSSVGTALAIALGAIAVVLSVAMLRASIAARRDEITIMGLVGATRSYIAAPIILEGALLGAAAAALASATLWAGHRAVSGSDSSVLEALSATSGPISGTLVALAVTVTVASAVTALAVTATALHRAR
jgi:cell division transport system permease protein